MSSKFFRFNGPMKTLLIFYPNIYTTNNVVPMIFELLLNLERIQVLLSLLCSLKEILYVNKCCFQYTSVLLHHTLFTIQYEKIRTEDFLLDLSLLPIYKLVFEFMPNLVSELCTILGLNLCLNQCMKIPILSLKL